jgi:DnaK suppressor protein
MDHLPIAAGYDRAVIRTALEAHRRRLTDALQRRVARLRDDGAAAMPPKELDEGDGYDLDVSLAEMEGMTLKRIDDALARLEDGRYGWCVRCHHPIAESRLRALPFALRCRHCEDNRERADRDRRRDLQPRCRAYESVPEL